MCDGSVVVYKSNLDVIVYVVGQRWESNELLLTMPLETIFDALVETIKSVFYHHQFFPTISFRPQLDKRSFLETYQDAAIIVDETVDRGIILETSVPDIVSKVSKTSNTTKVGADTVPMSEQTLSSAFSFAKDRFKSLLKQ